MTFHLADALALSDRRATRDGYMVASARAARTGIQTYAGFEVGKPEMPVVRVYRPEEEVFARDSLGSYAHKPITNDHPAEPVSATNWKQHAVGHVEGSIARDGEFVRIPLMMADAAAIADLEGGKRELSAGYTCDLDWTAGTTPTGEAYDAVQRNIRVNHVALVAKGRAGADCRIGDAAADLAAAKENLKDAIALHEKHMNGSAPTTGPAGEKSQQKMMDLMVAAYAALDGDKSKTSGMGKMDAAPVDLRRASILPLKDSVPMNKLTIDGIPVELSDVAAAAVRKLQDANGTLTADNLRLSAERDEARKAVETKDGEIAVLKKQVEDAKMTPAQIDAAVAARGKVISDARKIAGDALVVDGKTDAEIRRAAVAAKIGEAATSLSDQAIEGAFALAVADAKPADPLRQVIASGLRSNDATAATADAAHAAMVSHMTGAWGGAQQKGAA